MGGSVSTQSSQEYCRHRGIGHTEACTRYYLSHICDQLQGILPKVLVEAEDLQKHVRLKYLPLVGYRQQSHFYGNLQLSGSFCELLYIDSVIHADTGKPAFQSDLDILDMRDCRVVYPPKLGPSNGFELDTAGCSPGYTRVKKVWSNEYMETGTDKGQASKRIDLDYFYNEDQVPHLRCFEWDVSISSVLNTQTPHVWPTQHQREIMRHLVILLVHKIDPARKYANPLEYYRFSFSVVEKYLSISLPHCFRYIYLCTKLVLKFFCANTTLKSYFIKTIFFHFLSENFQDQEKFENLPSLGVLILIEELRKRFIEGRLANFFVPEMNLIQGINWRRRRKVVNILGDILSQTEVKLLKLASAIRVTDYRKLDRALIDADHARKIIAEAQSDDNQERAVRMRQAIELLERGTEIAPSVLMISLCLLHAYVLNKDIGKAKVLRHALNTAAIQRKRRSEERLEVLKLEPLHSSMFSSAISKALLIIPQPVYLCSNDYEEYVDLLCLQLILSQDHFYRYYESHWLEEELVKRLEIYYGRVPHFLPTKRTTYFFVRFALYVDMLQLLNSPHADKSYNFFLKSLRVVREKWSN